MFIKELFIKNFRLFTEFSTSINVPDNINQGSGLTVFVGENGCGKTTLLDSITLPLLSYKADNVCLNDFHNTKNSIKIKILAKENFDVARTIPRAIKFKAKGFSFEAKLRGRSNKSYLSTTIVSDQKYIKGHDEEIEDGSPCLRVTVNNPFSGIRFNENDIVFLDKNRTFQTRSGTYNTTKFDRLMEDFDFQYLKTIENNLEDLDQQLEPVKNKVKNPFFEEAINKFEEISGKKLSINVIDNLRPFTKAFFAEKKENNKQQIPLNMLGSGYEMIFSILKSFYLSKQSEKSLILIIDEPELHLHPKLQKDFVDLLIEFSKSAQIFLSTHSPLLVKQFNYNDKVKINVLTKMDDRIEIAPIERHVLPYTSVNEINYLAFKLATEEYHNELYGYLQSKVRKIDSFLVNKKIKRNKNWIEIKDHIECEPKPVTLQTYIRHTIHHPENTLNEKYNYAELDSSIEQMRNILNAFDKSST